MIIIAIVLQDKGSTVDMIFKAQAHGDTTDGEQYTLKRIGEAFKALGGTVTMERVVERDKPIAQEEP